MPANTTRIQPSNFCCK